jgi:pilus assembly protein CpaC
VENQYEKDVAGEIAALCILRDEKLESETRSGSSADAILSKVAVSQKIDVTDNVVNLLELRNPDQINISAMIIEIDSNDAKELGIKYGADVSNPGVYYLGESYGDSNRPNSGWFGRNWLYAHFSQINAQIGLALKNGKARVISEPNVTTMSGQDARIHVGGKITVPLTNSNGSMTTEDKEYGVELSLAKPVLDRQGNITTTLTTAVSKLDWGNAVNGIPGMRERSASTVVNIPSGMTMVIGGLMDSSDEETINKVPLLGNIPILGELFKYHDTTHNDSEILILITPRAVNEHSPVDMSKKMRDMYDTRRRNIEKGEHVDVNDPPGPSEEEKKAAAKAAKEAKDNEGKMLKLNKEAKGEAAEGDAAKAAVRENNAPPVESANSTAPVAADKKDSDKVAGATTVADETAGNAKVTETPSVMGKFLNRRVLK